MVQKQPVYDRAGAAGSADKFPMLEETRAQGKEAFPAVMYFASDEVEKGRFTADLHWHENAESQLRAKVPGSGMKTMNSHIV